jgi:hypothetical protein
MSRLKTKAYVNELKTTEQVAALVKVDYQKPSTSSTSMGPRFKYV